jgi:arginine decarboxylase-like protein
MSNLKCAVIFTLVITGVVKHSEIATAGPVFRPIPPLNGGLMNVPRPNPYQPIKPDGSNVSEESILMSKAWNEQFVKENYQAAAEIYVRVIQKYPQSAQAHFNLGVLLKEHSNNRAMSTKLLRTAHKLFQQEDDRYMIEATERHLRNQ